MRSKEVSNKYYDRLSRRGLEDQIPAERTQTELDFIEQFLGDDERILDLACGYGRLSIPLSAKGHSVVGVDLSEIMIEEAVAFARDCCADVEFLSADMQSLPFPDGSFSRIICWWSAFNSLLDREEQSSALEEMRRVLKDDGLAIIDLPYGDDERWLMTDGYVVKDYFVGGDNAVFLHDTKTMRKLCLDSGFSDFDIRKEWVGERKRMIVVLRR